ncbi:MAG: hypothetical protein MJ074_07630 [Oscillospiraceae bacterium]|nr:hypothetical protein [Oscillospiraceae bacterium]
MKLEENRFYINRREIAQLAEQNGYDADTACVVYAHRQQWTDTLEELRAFRKEMRRAQLSKEGTLYDLFK